MASPGFFPAQQQHYYQQQAQYPPQEQFQHPPPAPQQQQQPHPYQQQQQPRQRGLLPPPLPSPNQPQPKQPQPRLQQQQQLQMNGATERPALDGWEGGGMLDMYILDFLTKRGYRSSAQALSNEAGIALDEQVPIDAPQGLLYEWWSVFWELFTATGGPDQNRNGAVPQSMDAVLYVQAQQQAQVSTSLPYAPPPPHGTPNPSAQAGFRPPAASPQPPLRSAAMPYHAAQQQQLQDQQQNYPPHPKQQQQPPRGGMQQGYGGPPEGRPGGPYQQPPQIQMQSPSPNGLVSGQGGPGEPYGYMMQQNHPQPPPPNHQQPQHHLQPSQQPQLVVSQPRPHPPQQNQMQLQQQSSPHPQGVQHPPPGTPLQHHQQHQQSSPHTQGGPPYDPYEFLGISTGPNALDRALVSQVMQSLGLGGRDPRSLSPEDKNQVRLHYAQIQGQQSYQHPSGPIHSQPPRMGGQSRPRPNPNPNGGMTLTQAQASQQHQHMQLAIQQQMQSHHAQMKQQQMDHQNQKRRSNSPDQENGGPPVKRARKSPNLNPSMQQQHLNHQQQPRPIYMAAANSPVPQSPSHFGQVPEQPGYLYDLHDGRNSPAVNGGQPQPPPPTARPTLRRKATNGNGVGGLNGQPSAPSPKSQAGTPNPSAMLPPSTPGPSANGQRNPPTPKDLPPPSPASNRQQRPPTPLANSTVASPLYPSNQQQQFPSASPAPFTPASTAAPSPHYNSTQAPQPQTLTSSTPAHSPKPPPPPPAPNPAPMLDMSFGAFGSGDWSHLTEVGFGVDHETSNNPLGGGGGGGLGGMSADDFGAFDFEKYVSDMAGAAGSEEFAGLVGVGAGGGEGE